MSTALWTHEDRKRQRRAWELLIALLRRKNGRLTRKCVERRG